MERIAFIVDRLNMPPFSKGYATMTEIDSKSTMELLDLTCEIIITIDKDQETMMEELVDARLGRIIQFLAIMKFTTPPNVRMDELQAYLSNGDKEAWHVIIHWLLQKFEHLQKRAYLARYLMPVDVPPEFMGESLIVELMGHLKELQTEFKEVHKAVDQIRSSGTKPGELKAEITQLEQEKSQLQNKINKMKKDFRGDEVEFEKMLKVTSSLRKEQEEELRIYERLRVYRQGLEEADLRLTDAKKRLNEMRSSGLQNQSADQLLGKLQKDVKDLQARREQLEINMTEREMHLEKLLGWEAAGSERGAMTEDDVRLKREQMHDLEDEIVGLQERLAVALERNSKLEVFRQASSMAMKKLREKEDEGERLLEERRRVRKQIEDKENEMKAQGLKNPNSAMSSKAMGKKDFLKFEAALKEKLEGYKRMREELTALKAELVVLQRTEQILKDKNKNLDDFLSDLEKKKGIQGFRDTQRALVEMTEKSAEVDQLKGATLEEMSVLVEEIMRKFQVKKRELAPLVAQVKAALQEFTKLESEYVEKKEAYDKIAISYEVDRQALEKECDTSQDDYLREETRYHTLNSLNSIAKIKVERAEQEKKFRSGDGKLMRDFASLKDLYAHKISQQEQLTKQLRKRQKDLKENASIMSNQKVNFKTLQGLLDAKQRSIRGSTAAAAAASNASSSHMSGGANIMSFD